MTDAIEATGYLKHILSHDENVAMIVRQHWLVLFGRLFWPLFWFAALIIAVTCAKLYAMPDRPEVLYGYALALIPWASVFWRYIVWRNQTYILTNRRVIHMNGVFEKQVSDSLLEKLNDIKTDQTLLGRIFGYGDIEILTASEAGISNLRHIAKPLEFKRAMLDGKEELDRALSHH
ncbi:MAG: PH domain-containing protein [Parvibaculaceae bacterium]